MDRTPLHLAGLLIALAASPSSQCQLDLLVGGDAQAFDQAGVSIDQRDNLAIVGAPFHGGGTASRTGGAYLFARGLGGWREIASLAASDGVPFDEFGTSVALEADLALVGAPGRDAERGAAYLFGRTGGVWTEVARLAAGDGAGGDRFGSSVTLTRKRIFVGAPHDDDDGPSSGAVYVFDLSGAGWTQVAKLRGGGAGPYDEFGAALAVDGGTLVVGAPDSVMGAAHVFERRGKAWFELQRLEQGSPFGHDRFGAALALEDDTLLVGAPFETGVAAIDSGVVYAYERDSSGWQPTDRLLPGDANPLGNFGWDLAVSGDDAILGARHESPAGVFSGSAYLFHRAGTAWSEVTKIVPSDGRPSDGFGAAVSLSGDVALVGAPMVTFGGTPQSTPDELISGSGAVYAWSISSGHCPPLYAAPRTISLAAGGTQFFTLRAGAEHGGRMYLLLGSTSGTSPGFSFGDVVLPLNVDAYFARTLRHPNFPPYTASQGFLDGEGVAEARFALPPGLDPSFVGTTLHHAYGVIDPASWRVLLVSDPDPLLLAP